MNKWLRAAWAAFVHGLLGAFIGMMVGTVIGVVLGDVIETIQFSACYGALLFAVFFGCTALIFDYGWVVSSPWRRSVSKPVVLFLCTNNAVRSQMAEAFLRRRASDRFEARSAGTEPREIHPMTIRVMKEVGVDLDGQSSKSLRQYLGTLPVRYAVFVCRKQIEAQCPATWPGALMHLEWPFDDPLACSGSEEERIARFRFVRDQIDEKVAAWVREHATG